MHHFNLALKPLTLSDTEPKTFGPFGLKSEHVPLALLRTNGNSPIGSRLAIALSRFINSDTK